MCVSARPTVTEAKLARDHSRRTEVVVEIASSRLSIISIAGGNDLKRMLKKTMVAAGQRL